MRTEPLKFLFAGAMLALIVTVALGTGTPSLMNYQGRLTDAGGNLLTGIYSVVFTIYDDPTASAPANVKWQETHSSVSVADGLFNVVLGAGTPAVPLPAGVFTSPDRWLGIKVGTDTEISPRTRLVSFAYAFTARSSDSADLLDGKHAADLVNLGQAAGGDLTGSYPNPTISANAVTSGKIQDGTITRADATSNFKAPFSDTADYARAGAADKDWSFRTTDTADTTLITGGAWGIARYGNILYGNKDSTHVNLGVACTTGTSGWDFSHSTVGGGFGNAASGGYATIAGGWSNVANNGSATVGGGNHNVAGNGSTTVGGGAFNTASGWGSTVPGGYGDTAAGYCSFAAGNQVRVNADNTLAFGNNFTTSASHAVIFHDTGTPIKVGIGTTSPGAPLEVRQLEGSPALRIESGSPENTYWLDVRPFNPFAGSVSFAFDVKAAAGTFSNLLVLQSLNGATGAVGIGTAYASEALDVNGTARLRSMSTGSGTDVVVDGNGVLMKKSSSLRYKENIRNLNPDLYQILQLKPVRFDWRTTGEEDIGLVAEEVEKTVPDLVIYDQEGKPDAVKYDKITVYLLEVVKAQQRKIDAQQEQLDMLKAKLERLEARH